MKTIATFITLIVCLASSFAQTYDTNNPVVQTFAGSDFYGYLDGQGQQTMFRNPERIVSDSHSNLFIWDSNNYRVREISSDATVTTFAGGGLLSPPAYGTAVSMSFGLQTLVSDVSNDVMWGASRGQLVRIEPDAFVSSAVGGPLTVYAGIYGDSLCLDSQHNIYFTFTNCVMRSLPSGSWEVFAGSGNQGTTDGNGIFTSFYSPVLLSCDTADNVYVYENGLGKIRRISQSRQVRTIAGGTTASRDGYGLNAGFSTITSACIDQSGNIYMAEAYANAIRRMNLATTNVTTVAGAFNQSGYTNGPGYLARFNNPEGICFCGGSLYVCDAGNQRIRQIAFDPSSQPVQPANLALHTYPGIDVSGTVGRTYRIESSTNMSTWTSEATFLLTSNPQRWFDQNALGVQKFYRAFLLP